MNSERSVSLRGQDVDEYISGLFKDRIFGFAASLAQEENDPDTSKSGGVLEQATSELAAQVSEDIKERLLRTAPEPDIQRASSKPRLLSSQALILATLQQLLHTIDGEIGSRDMAALMSHIAVIATSSGAEALHPAAVTRLAWHRTYPHASQPTYGAPAAFDPSGGGIQQQPSETGSELSSGTTIAHVDDSRPCAALDGSAVHPYAGVQQFPCSPMHPAPSRTYGYPLQPGLASQAPFMAPCGPARTASMFYPPFNVMHGHTWPALTMPPAGFAHALPAHLPSWPPAGLAQPPAHPPVPPSYAVPAGTPGPGESAHSRRLSGAHPGRNKACASVASHSELAHSCQAPSEEGPEATLPAPEEPSQVRRRPSRLSINVASLEPAKDDSDEVGQYAPSPIIPQLQQDKQATPSAGKPELADAKVPAVSDTQENVIPRQTGSRKSAARNSGPAIDIGALTLGAQAGAAAARQAARHQALPSETNGLAQQQQHGRRSVLAPVKL